jgi:hypothetical protein
MKQSSYELTLTNVLADPMIRTVMAADRVDPHELATMLAAMAQTLQYAPPRLSHAAQLTRAG